MADWRPKMTICRMGGGGAALLRNVQTVLSFATRGNAGSLTGRILV
jgi:hypothetical protein